MAYEMTTYPMTESQLRAELEFFVKYFTKNNIATCQLMFGWAWGLEYYPEKDWISETIALPDLILKITEVEQTYIGKFSDDDLFITLEKLEFKFCHESDIHIVYDQSNNDTENFYTRWQTLGYKPTIKQKESK